MKKVKVAMTVTEEFTSRPVVVLEVSDDVQQWELLSLGVGFFFEIFFETLIPLQSDKTDMDIVDRFEINAAGDNDQTVARLIRGESGKIEWQWPEAEAADKSLNGKIRRSARKQHLVAQKSRKDGLWYFSDETNLLRSSERGMDSRESLDWLERLD